ncbi:MAG: SRPBCC domain-containing protein [FCB group bacterium]|jgi:uncharacterized protein YndB with AHSA1/START domain
MNNEPVVIEQAFNVTPEKVWTAITELEKMKQWYMKEIELFEPEVGFQTEFTVHEGEKDYLHIWKVTEVVPLEKISYEWKFGGYPGNTLVTFWLSSEDNKTKLILTHENLKSFHPDINPELSREEFIHGWKSLICTSLKKFLESNSV